MRARTWLFILAAAPASVFVLSSLAYEIPDFFDPCHSWGAGNRHTSAPTDECPSVSASSETKSEALVRLIAIQGTTSWATGLAAFGLIRAHRLPLVLGIGLLYGISVPLLLGVSGFFTLASALLFTVASLARWETTTAPAAA